MATKKPLPKKYQSYEQHIIKLSKEGLSKSLIIQNLSLPVNFFNAYLGTDAWFNFGRSEFAKEVLNKTSKNVEYNASTQKYLLEKMQVFRYEFTIPKISDSKSAQKALSICIQLYAQKEISEVELQQVRSSVQIFNEIHTSVDLQRQIEELRELIEKGSRNGK